MSFQVTITPRAEEDLRSILNWIGERSASGAEAWFNRWEETLVAIEARADRYGLAPESEDASEPLRQAIFKTRRGRYYRVVSHSRPASLCTSFPRAQSKYTPTRRNSKTGLVLM
jgi:plasmid stabilization system protein ParE